MELETAIEQLQRHDIRPSAQRVAIARYVLETHDHPSADQVWQRVKTQFPMVSRATVYNTLNLFVAKGLLQELTLAPGFTVYDPKTDRHHHFLDDATGAIHDVPWDSLDVSRVDALRDYEVRDYTVVLRGRRRRQT